MAQFQRQGTFQETMEAISKARSDENDEQICVVRTPNFSNIARDYGCSNNEENTASDASYTSWIKRHPSALSMFDWMMTPAKGKRVVVFLDNDGTLSPIVEDPSRAFMSDSMRSVVREVARYFPTAIISGRSRDKVYEFVKLTSVYYAGSHGMDIMAPVPPLTISDAKHQTRVVDEQGNEGMLFQPAKEFLPTIQEIITALEEKTKDIHGVVIENNRFCVSIHFRRVQEEVMRDPNGISRGSGFVAFSTSEEASRALGLVIDLTNTNRYYPASDWRNQDSLLLKLNDNKSEKEMVKRQSSDSSPSQLRTVRPRLYFSVDSDSD